MTATLQSPADYFEVQLTPHTSLAYVRAHSNVTTQYIRQNIPKAALHDLHLALGGRSELPRAARNEPDDFLRRLRRQYLGVDDDDALAEAKIKHVYMTESDQILHARPTPEFLRHLEAGKIVIPHRIQPIPHNLDLHGIGPTKVLPAGQFPPQNVVELDYDGSSCCDTGRHLFVGRTDPRKPACGDVWWRCGFGSLPQIWQRRRRNGRDDDPDAADAAIREAFGHLRDYDFMRLGAGTNIVALAASEWSRRCKPVPDRRGC